MHLTGVYLTGVYLTGVYLTGVYLTGVQYILYLGFPPLISPTLFSALNRRF
jgi:hypothetical protein